MAAKTAQESILCNWVCSLRGLQNLCPAEGKPYQKLAITAGLRFLFS